MRSALSHGLSLTAGAVSKTTRDVSSEFIDWAGMPDTVPAHHGRTDR